MRKYLLFFLLIATAVPMNAQKLSLDFPGLSEKASEVVDITLDAQMLRLASKFLSATEADERNVRDIVGKLEGIYVRSYEFDKEGDYDRALVDRVRAQLGSSWKKIVNVRSKKHDNAEIYLDMRGDQAVGLVVIAAEPRQLTIVNIVGPIDLDKLSHLEGEFGIPRMSKKGQP
jgi:hypothetical protein